MKVIFINSDFFWCNRKPRDYVGTKGFYQALLDFKEDRCSNCTDEFFLKHHDNYLVYSTAKELPSDLKYEGLVKDLYPRALDWFDK